MCVRTLKACIEIGIRTNSNKKLIGGATQIRQNEGEGNKLVVDCVCGCTYVHSMHVVFKFDSLHAIHAYTIIIVQRNDVQVKHKIIKI